jgi:hypothetical protein
MEQYIMYARVAALVKQKALRQIDMDRKKPAT